MNRSDDPTVENVAPVRGLGARGYRELVVPHTYRHELVVVQGYLHLHFVFAVLEFLNLNVILLTNTECRAAGRVRRA